MQETPKKAKPKFFSKLKKQWELQTMVWPAVIFMLVFNIYPIYGLVIAFKRFTVIDRIDTAPWVGLQNFEIIMKDAFFWKSVWNTLGISFMKLLFGFGVPIILAIMIYEMRDGKLKKLIQTISYMPYFLSWIVLGGMLINWLSTVGLLNSFLEAIGIETKNQNYLLDVNKYWWIAVFSDIWKNAGWGTILYLATLAKIDPTYYEAAKIDGATRMQQIRHITLPSLKNIIVLNFILSISSILGSNLDQTMVLMNSQNQPRSEVINSYVFRMGIVQGDFSYATAVGLGISIVSVILLVTANLLTKKINDNKSVL